MLYIKTNCLVISIICFLLIIIISISCITIPIYNKEQVAFNIDMSQDNTRTVYRIEAPKYLSESEMYFKNNSIDNVLPAELPNKDNYFFLYNKEQAKKQITELSLNISSIQATTPQPFQKTNNTYIHNIEYKYTITEQDIFYLATLIQLEVLGANSNMYDFEDTDLKYWEMLAVAQCVLNRTQYNGFENTIQGVIFESHRRNGKTIYQFSPAPALDKFNPTKEAVAAAKDVLFNKIGAIPQNYYYFCATKIEERFERSNKYCFVLNEDGSYDKIRGHQTTFYAGK